MVRLKAAPAAPKHKAYPVSIPNGTIKRNVVRRNYTFLLVSIPNGTIKRQHRQRPSTRRIQFQFQMVRLKEHRQRPSTRRIQFQFQMVRLKVSFRLFSRSFIYVSIPNGTIKSDLITINADGSVTSFNSKWYD